MRRILLSFLITLAVIIASPRAFAVGYVQVDLPVDKIPQERDDQRTLHAFMATLTAADFAVEKREFTVVPATDPDDQFRMWLLGQHPPTVSSMLLPPETFTLAAIESQKSLAMPAAPVESHSLSWLASWNYAGNPYFNSRPIKLRAFMLAATDMMMLDYLYDHDPRGADRSDYLGGNLIWIGFTYLTVKDLLPADVQAAFETGLKRHVKKLEKWGPKGSMTDMDLFASVGLTYVTQAMSDKEVKEVAAKYIKLLYTNPLYFNKAGYFVDNHCFDTSYNGISLFFGSWCAILTDKNPARDAIEKAYYLREHLCFPAPDGTFSGPGHMSARCSSDPPREQWQFAPKMWGSGMITDEALHITTLPTPEEVKSAPAAVIAKLNDALAIPSTAKPETWKESHWCRGSNYPYDLYPKGYYARRLKLEAEKSKLLKPLYLRDENFIHEFNNAFTIARFDKYAAAIHTGEIGKLDGYWHRPFGFGGGELSAFWTPATGVTVLGRRRGIQGRTFDSWDEWRIWPVHAVTGITAGGDVVTSSRIRIPGVDVDKSLFGNSVTVKVDGMLPRHKNADNTESATGIHYLRTFKLNSGGVTVKTELETKQAETFVELYETIPVLLAEIANQKPTSIQLQVNGAWTDATPDFTNNVDAVKLTRFDGSTTITFKMPERVKLSPTIWEDGYQTTAQCRTVLIDLLDADKKLDANKVIEYTVCGGK